MRLPQESLAILFLGFTLKNISRKKDVKYIGVTGFKVISHEKHLFLEVYKNSKEAKKIPIARIVLTKKDFGTYFPETGDWSQKRVEERTYSYRDKMIWSSDETEPDRTKKENLLQSNEDLERIKNFCKVEIWRAERWWEYIEKYQNNISTNARIKREKRKLERRHPHGLQRRKSYRCHRWTTSFTNPYGS